MNETVLTAIVAVVSALIGGALSGLVAEVCRSKASHNQLLFETRVKKYDALFTAVAEYIKDTKAAGKYADMLAAVRQAGLVCSPAAYPLLMRFAKILESAEPDKSPSEEFKTTHRELSAALRKDLRTWRFK